MGGANSDLPQPLAGYHHHVSRYLRHFSTQFCIRCAWTVKLGKNQSTSRFLSDSRSRLGNLRTHVGPLSRSRSWYHGTTHPSHAVFYARSS